MVITLALDHCEPSHDDGGHVGHDLDLGHGHNLGVDHDLDLDIGPSTFP